MVDKISEFQGNNRWLSNFWIADQEIAGQIYSCNEQWYVMNKCEDLHDEIMAATKSGDIKRLGRKCKMRENWDNMKIPVMKIGLIRVRTDSLMASRGGMPLSRIKLRA